MTMFGREVELALALKSNKGVILIQGEPGSGKSELLQNSQQLDINSVAPNPVQARRSPGALNRAVLEALGEALALIAEDESVSKRVVARLGDFAARIAKLKGDDLAAFIFGQVTGVIRSRLGDHAASAIEGAADLLAHSDSQILKKRLAEAQDDDVADLLIEFALEISRLADDKCICVAVDNADNLDEGDMRRLADLAERLPPQFKIRAAFMSSSPESRDRLSNLAVAGAQIVEAGAMDEESIGNWLLENDLPKEWAVEVRRATSGFPLFVQSAIELLKVNESVDALRGLEATQVLAEQTEMAWRHLTPELKVVVTTLCGIAGNISPSESAELTGVSRPEWNAIEHELSNRYIFSGEPRWFHELRRRHLLHSVFNDNEREGALNVARMRLENKLDSRLPDADDYIGFARLIRENPTLQTGSSNFQSVLGATSDEIAILASFIELSNGASTELLADIVLTYAVQFYRGSADLPSALESLRLKGLITVKSNEFTTTISVAFDELPTWNLIAGLAGEMLGRIPVSELATTLFDEALTPLLGDFQIANYGIGHEPMATLSQIGDQTIQSYSSGPRPVRQESHSLAARFTFGSVPVFATVTFGFREERAQAVQRLKELDKSIMKQDLRATVVFELPMERVPMTRLVRACERVTGIGLARTVNGIATAPRLSEGLDLEAEMEERARAVEVFRDILPEEERYAYQLETPIGYVYSGDRASNSIAQIYGRVGATRIGRFFESPDSSGLYRFDIANGASLIGDERVGPVTARYTRSNDEPNLAELAMIVRKAAMFNSHQPRKSIPLDEVLISDLLNEAALTAERDAAILRSRLTFHLQHEGHMSSMTGTSEHMVLYRDTDLPAQQSMAGAEVFHVRTRAESELPIHFKMLPLSELPDLSGESGESYMKVLGTITGVDPSTFITVGHGTAIEFMASRLGFGMTDIMWTD